MRKYILILAAFLWVAPFWHHAEGFTNFKFSASENWKEYLAEHLKASLPAPQIQSISPGDNSEKNSPFSTIEVHWDQPVDPDSFFEHLSISPDLPSKYKREIRLAWDYQKNPSMFQVRFLPNLPEETLITVRITPGVQSLFGEKRSQEEFLSTFQTSKILPIETLFFLENLRQYFTQINLFLFPKTQ